MTEKTLSPKSLALHERRRHAAEEGVKALAEYEAHDVAVRNNMAKLRALRLANEAESAATESRKPPRKRRKI